MDERRDNDNPKPSPSPWSFRLATVDGIPIRIHFTFLLLLAWIALVGRSQSGFLWPGFLVAVFGCVLLHELGHAFAAKRKGILTRDITLYPMGGLAMLDGRPAPKHEIGIALAGPLVNFVIAGALAAGLYYRTGTVEIDANLTRETFLSSLLIANLWLGVFNLIPTFPMDGGRVLRAVLALRMGEVRATQIAVMVGQFLAILLGFLGLFQSNVVLMLIAFFVFIGAGQELGSVVTRSLLQGRRAADAMQTRYRVLASGDSLQTAADYLLAGSQSHFPVMLGDETIGILTRDALARGLATEGPDSYVAGVMRRDLRTCSEDDPLESVAEEIMKSGESLPVLVLRDGEMVGMVTPENLSEFLMLESAVRQAAVRAA